MKDCFQLLPLQSGIQLFTSQALENLLFILTKHPWRGIIMKKKVRLQNKLKYI